MTLGRIGSGLLRPVNVNERPYPWVGSGTHAWVHYDSRSRSHTCQVVFRYSGSVTLDWGDGSQKVTLTNGNYSRTVQSHTYADGDWRIDITGATPLHFGEYTYDGSYHNVQNYGEGFLSDDMPFSVNYTKSTVPRDALVQFETDSPMIYGAGNGGYAMLGDTANLKWVNFTEATAIANIPIGNQLGLIGFFAPKCEKMWNFAPFMPSLTVMKIPSVSTFYSDAGTTPCSFDGALTALPSLYIPDGMTTLPPNFMRNAYRLADLRLPATLAGTITNPGWRSSVRDLEIPHGVTEIASEAFREDSSLSRLVLPSTLTNISGSLAFYGNNGLITIICRATTPPTLASSNVLSDGKRNAGFGIWVPQGTIPAYEAATNWSQFAGKFHELDANGNVPQS